ncbi:MAG: AI-2E family transporter [Clostridiales bacterium]|nr:AI-2E family transporter [Clostridiales bacterium]
MFLNRNIKYRDILIFALIGVIGYKFIDNYQIFFDLLSKFLSIISPFIYGGIFAYCLNPVMKLCERKIKAKRTVAILITFLLITGLFFIGFIYIIPSLVDSIIAISSDVPEYMDKVQNFINQILNNQNIHEMVKEAGLLDYLTSLSNKLGSFLLSFLEGSVTSLVSFVSNIVKVIVGYLISIYLLFDKEKIIDEGKTLNYIIFKKEKGGKILEILSTYNKMIGLYIGTKAIDSLIIEMIALVGLILIGEPYSVLVALFVGITNMIPYFGPFIGIVVGGFIGLFVSPMTAVIVVIFLLALQQFDAWFLEPKLVGGRIGIRPVLVIFGVLIGGGFFGAIGMILATPTIATIKLLYDKKIAKFKKENKELFENVEAHEIEEKK